MPMLLRNVCFRNIWKIIIGRRRERLKTFKNRILLLFDEVNFRNALYNINAYINKVETKLVKNRECLKIVQWGLQAFCCYSIVKWCTPMKLERFPQKYLLSKTSEPFLQKFNNLLTQKSIVQCANIWVIFQKYLRIIHQKVIYFLRVLKSQFWSCVCPDVVFTFNKSDGHRFLLPYFLFSNPLSVA